MPISGAGAQMVKKALSKLERLPITAKFVIALILALSGLGTRYLKAVRAPGIDFWRPLVVTSLAKDQSHFDVYSRAGRERIYQLAVLRHRQSAGPKSREATAALISSRYDVRALSYQGVDVVQTPFLLALMQPLTGMSYDHAHHLYLITSLLCFFGASYLLAWVLGFSSPVSLAIGGMSALCFTAEVSDVTIGNVNAFQLVVLALFLWLQRIARSWSDVMSGVVFGLGVGLKPNLAIVLPVVGIVWLGERAWGRIVRVVLGVWAGLFIVWLAAGMILPGVKWKDWFQVVPQLAGSTQPFSFGNMSLASIVTQMSGIDVSRPFLVIGILLLAAIALRPLWTHQLSAGAKPIFVRTVLGVSAGVLLMLLSSRLVWGHYVVLALPAILYVAENAFERGGIRLLIGSIAIVLLSVVLKAAGSIYVEMVAGDVALLIIFGWVLVDLWGGGAVQPANVARQPAL